MQLSAVASLAVAASKEGPSSEAQVRDLVEVVRSTAPPNSISGNGWRNHILWVDDRPNNNINERRAFEAVGLRFTLAESTKKGLNELAKQQFAAIISDMGRREGPRRGTCCWTRSGNRATKYPYFSMRVPTHPNTGARLLSTVDRAAPATRRNCFG
jgi:hypothetical protein